jgi:hypothetical protein
MNITQVKASLPILIKAKITPLLMGIHGVGKTSGVKQFCEENGYEFRSFRLGQLADAGDMTGLPSIENGVTEFLQPAWWPTNGRGIIFLDEINRARRDLLQCVFELCEKGEMNGRKLPEGWAVIAAGNPDSDDYIVTSTDDKAFLDRFCVIKITSSYNDFLTYGKAQKFNKSVTGFITAHPAMLRGNNQDFTLKFVEPSDRSWEKVGLLANLYDNKEMDEATLNELVAGLVGTEASTTFISWKKNAEKPVEGAKVLKDYASVKEKIQTQITSENYRSDLLNETCNQILELLSPYAETDIPNQEYSNLVAFLNDIPNDIFTSTIHKCFKIPKLFMRMADDKILDAKTESALTDKQKATKNEKPEQK